MTGFRHGTVLSSTAADYAYLMLREGIEIGRFLPGRRMREVELAEWLGVSRTPIRQALSRLHAEGMLALAPRQGLVVQSLDRRGVAELYELRMTLEGMAARLAAASASRGEIAGLERLVDAERNLGSEPRAPVRHNRAFHQAIYEAAHNRFLLRTMRSITDALDLLGQSTLLEPGRQEAARREHEEIVAAIAAGDQSRAELLARRHIDAGLALRVGQMAAEPAPADQSA